MSGLLVSDNKERITAISRRQGYTYHLLLIQETNKTVMHFRIFETTDPRTNWCSVYPCSDSGFGYFNDQIGSRLHSHLPSNALPPGITRAVRSNQEK